MKVCSSCRSQVGDQYTTCPNCGSPNLTVLNYQQSVQTQNGNIAWAILGFFVPIAGLVLYLVWKDSKPADSKMAGKGALISVIVSAGLCLLYIIFMVIIFIITLIPLIFSFM